jgi:hypothetical protein
MGPDKRNLKGIGIAGVMFTWALLSFQLSAQIKIRDIRYLASDTSKLDINARIPQVELADSSIARSINTYLQLKWLQNTSKSVSREDLFNRIAFVSNDSSQRLGITEFDYQLIFQNQQIASFEFQYEWMGAYPESHSDYLTFNLKNGRVVQMIDLFTEEGSLMIKAELLKRRKMLVENAEKEWKNELSPEDYASIKEDLFKCIQSPEINRAAITPNGIRFHHSFCFPGVSRALEPDLRIELSRGSLKPWLSEYGRKILLDQNADIKAYGTKGKFQPLVGTIGKYPIVMVLDHWNLEHIRGWYFYKKKEIAIELIGQLTGDSLELVEYAEDEPFGTFSGKLITGQDGSIQFSGSWKSNGKSLPVHLKN